MDQIDLLIARAQVWIVVLFSVGAVSVMKLLMIYHKDMTSTEVTILTGLLSSLATIVALQQNFLFARSKNAAIPDPSATTTSTPTPVIVPAGSTIAQAAPVVAAPLVPNGVPK